MPLLSFFPPDHHPLLFRPSLLPGTSSLSSTSNLPSGILRKFIYANPSQGLELLIATPANHPTSQKKRQRILFIHGGFGSAVVWLPFLNYFSQHQTHPHKSYALSLRGHGNSWRPGYMEMVYQFGVRDFASDAKFAINEITRMEKEEDENWSEEQLVIVGHSAGGGVSQRLMGEMDVKAGGLVLMSCFPASGGWPIYKNWALLDPLFLLRFLFRDFTHSRSPLSSTSLVHRTFFSSRFPVSGVQAFEKNFP